MFDILYQDQDLVAINKPTGWLVHKSWLDPKEHVVIMQTLRDQIDQHVFPVHRLDRPTSGVLLFALSSAVARRLSQQFEQQQVTKIYHAVVRGHPKAEGVIDYALSEIRDKIADKYATTHRAAQSAITQYRTLQYIELPISVRPYPTARYALMELIPQTGRKHQLRRHMHHIFHPIIGDTTHGDLHHNRALSTHYQCQRLLLHASHLYLTHPLTQNPLLLSAPWDTSWQQLMQVWNWDHRPPPFLHKGNNP